MEVINGEYAFCKLVSKDGRSWQVFVKSNVPLVLESHEDKSLPAWQYTVYGQKTKTTSALTAIEGKNIGRKNETSNLMQAIKQSESMISKKLKAGYSLVTETAPESTALYPMAVSPAKDRKISFPLYAQPKLDGIRMIASARDLKSRRLHDIEGFEFVKAETDILISRLPELNFLDGELYAHGLPLQEISGIVRSGDESSPKRSLKYHIFDVCFKDMSIPFVERSELLARAFVGISFEYLSLVPTILLETQEEADSYFNELVSDGYEGLIYKPSAATYEASSVREKRSIRYLKRKASFEEEFLIESYTSGSGKFEGLVVFILKTEEGHLFNCVPLGDSEYRAKLYSECEEDFSKYKGKLAKVRFDDWSKDKIPLRGVITQLDRDLSFD